MKLKRIDLRAIRDIISDLYVMQVSIQRDVNRCRDKIRKVREDEKNGILIPAEESLLVDSLESLIEDLEDMGIV